MDTIKVSFSGNVAMIAPHPNVRLTTGSENSIAIEVAVDESWNSLNLDAVFVGAPASWEVTRNPNIAAVFAIKLDSQNAAVIPKELLRIVGMHVFFGISGSSGDVSRSSSLTMLGIVEQGADPEYGNPGDIAPSRYDELSAQIGNLSNLDTADKSNLVAAINEVFSLDHDSRVHLGEEPGDRDIPMLFFGGALPQTKTARTMPFRYVSETEDIFGYVSTKAQGNSSMSYPKKNQTVKLYSDEGCTKKLKLDFKDWGKQSKFCCKANWIDITHARNIVSARLWGDVVKSRADYEDLPELLRTSPNQGAIDGFPVKVYADGIYQGRYTLNIPKDKWMANMDDTLDTHCILCGENYVSGCFRASASINGSDWTDEIHDTVPEAIKTRWNQVISFVMNSTDNEFKENLSQYFYVDSLIDYHLFGLISCGLDAYGKNQLYMTYDGQKWIASMYDMDSTWGLWWNGRSFVATDYDRSAYQDFKDGSGNLLYIRLEQLFYEQLQNRWAELKTGALSKENILRRFEQFMSITPKDLVTEDYASTTAGGSFTGIPSTSTNTIQQIRAYAADRWDWCDEYVAGLTPEPEILCTGITVSPTSLSFTETGTQTITATVTPTNTTESIQWSTSASDVATVSGGVVTAVGNGDAVVTATCGSHSATCSVTVSGIGGAASLLPTGAAYSLSAETTFNGTSDYVDTGVKLFETNSDFSIAFSFSNGESNVHFATLLHSIKEANPYPGLLVDVHVTTYRLVNEIRTDLAATAADAPGVHRMVIVKNASTKVISLYWDTFSNKIQCNNPGLVTATFDNTLVIGARKYEDGSIARYWSGTVHELAVYNRQFTEEEITTYLDVDAG